MMNQHGIRGGSISGVFLSDDAAPLKKIVKQIYAYIRL
jgi:hypothetical protein